MKRKRSQRGRKGQARNGISVGRVVLLSLLAGSLALIVLITMVHGGAFGKLPTREDLAGIRNEEATLVLASDGTIIGKLFAEERTNIAFKDLPPQLVNALVSTEDSRFFRHEGVDAFSYLRVLLRTVLGGDRSGGGGSTISQQIVKNLYGRERHGPLTVLVNKIKEAVVAYRLEQVYDKEEVLLLYFNSVPFGENVFGVEAAARRFFGKPAARLRTEESAVLVGMLKANTSYNPRLHPEPSLQRRNVVLKLMQEQGHLTPQEKDSLQALPIALNYKGTDALDLYAYFVEQVAREAEAALKEVEAATGKAYALRSDGLRIHTTLDTELQHAAARSAKEQLRRMQPKLDAELKRNKARTRWEKEMGKRNDPRWKADVKAKRELFTVDGPLVDSIGHRDSLWHYHRMLNCAVFAMEPGTGKVRAWVGGNDHRHLPYDLVHAQRQIASTIKPLIYAAALESGLTPCTYLSNEKVTYAEYDDWSPDNFSQDTLEGEVAMWYALTRSMNMPTVDLYFRTGRDTLRTLFRKLDLPTRQLDKPAVALGASDISLRTIVRAYAAFAMRGSAVSPVLVERITDANGKELWKAPPKRSVKAMSDSTAAAVTAMLQRAVNEGTGASLRSTYGVTMPFAGKTGTSQGYSDAWFVGYSQGLAIGTWVGAMDPSIHFGSANGTGTRLALPVVGATLREVERSAAMRERYARPFGWVNGLAVDMDCDPRQKKSALEELIEDIFHPNREGTPRRKDREKEEPDYTSPPEGVSPKKDKNFFDRLFRKKQ